MFNSDIFGSVVTIIVFLSVFIFLSLLLKKFYSNRKISELGINFKILGKLPLTNKATLFIVQIGSRVLLLGTSENSISALADLSRAISTEQHLIEKQIAKEVPQIKLYSIPPTRSSTGFKEFLKETFKKSKN